MCGINAGNKVRIAAQHAAAKAVELERVERAYLAAGGGAQRGCGISAEARAYRAAKDSFAEAQQRVLAAVRELT